MSSPHSGVSRSSSSSGSGGYGAGSGYGGSGYGGSGYGGSGYGNSGYGGGGGGSHYDDQLNTIIHQQYLPWLKPDQVDKLERGFTEQRFPAWDDIIILAAELDMTEDQVKTWYEHRQAAWRSEQGLPPTPGRIQA